MAYIDGGVLQEIHIEREAKRGIVGNIYKGRVSRVLPGMQAAFVDIGLENLLFFMPLILCRILNALLVMNKKTFMYVILANWFGKGKILWYRWLKIRLEQRRSSNNGYHITIPLFSFMLGASHVGVSQRIESEEERQRLKSIVELFCDENGGFIIRTAAEGVGDDELAQDAAF